MPKLVGGLDHFLFSHILGIIIPSDFHIFQKGSNHQPAKVFAVPVAINPPDQPTPFPTTEAWADWSGKVHTAAHGNVRPPRGMTWRCHDDSGWQRLVLKWGETSHSGWWWMVAMFYFPRNIGNVIIPSDELIFFRGVAQPPTSHCSI